MAADVYSPINGEVILNNQDTVNDITLVNKGNILFLIKIDAELNWIS